MNQLYTITRYEYGYTISAPCGRSGVPCESFSDLSKLLPKNSSLCPGIASSLNVIAAAATTKDAELWENEINKSLESLPTVERWIRGTDTGLSSMTIFVSMITNPAFDSIAQRHLNGRGYTPQDSSDFGRCYRLLETFPEWEPKLEQVGTRFPDTKWTAISKSWPELKSLYESKNFKELGKRLRELNSLSDTK